MKKFLSLFLFTVLMTGCTINNSDKKETTDEKSTVGNAISTMYYGGDIITMEGDSAQYAEAVVVTDGKIAFVGSKEEAMKMAGNGHEMVDLQGKTMLPGLIEQHMHPLLAAIFLSMPSIAPEEWETPEKTYPAVTTPAAYLAALQSEFANRKDTSGTFYVWGYHQLWHGPLTRDMLDKISTTVPIGVWHRSCHEFFVNTAYLKKFNIDAAEIAKQPADIRAQIDLKKGHFFENGEMVYLLPTVYTDIASQTKLKKGLQLMVQYLHRNGVTAYNDPGTLFDAPTAKLYNEILNKEDVPMLATFIPEGNGLFMSKGDSALQFAEAALKTFPEGGRLFFLPKHIKFLADGSIVSQLMQMKDGYIDGHKGEWMLKPELMEKATKLFWNAGYQIHIHVTGDKAMDVVLDCIERRMKENPRKDHRTTIVHFANSTEDQVKRLAALGCIVSGNPYYVTGFSDKFSQYGLGHDRAEAMVRIGSVEKLGVPISLHSDMPMGPADPLFIVWCAITRKGPDGKVFRPDLAISRHAALRAITIDAAQSWRMEDKIGSIKKGKNATFTILEQNPYKVDVDAIKDIKVNATVFQGKMFPVK